MSKVVIDTGYACYLLEAPEEIVLHISEYIQHYILNGDGHKYYNESTQEWSYEVEGLVAYINNECLQNKSEKVTILEKDIESVLDECGSGTYKYPMAFLD